MGEAAASLGFAAARIFDDLEPLEKQKNALMKQLGVSGKRAVLKALQESEQRAIELLGWPRTIRGARRWAADPMVDFVLKDSEADVLCPATKLWNTGVGANMMREAVSLMAAMASPKIAPDSWPTSGWTRSWRRPTRGRRRCSGAS